MVVFIILLLFCAIIFGKGLQCKNNVIIKKKIRDDVILHLRKLKNKHIE